MQQFTMSHKSSRFGFVILGLLYSPLFLLLLVLLTANVFADGIPTSQDLDPSDLDNGLYLVVQGRNCEAAMDFPCFSTVILKDLAARSSSLRDGLTAGDQRHTELLKFEEWVTSVVAQDLSNSQKGSDPIEVESALRTAEALIRFFSVSSSIALPTESLRRCGRDTGCLMNRLLSLMIELSRNSYDSFESGSGQGGMAVSPRSDTVEMAWRDILSGAQKWAPEVPLELEAIRRVALSPKRCISQDLRCHGRHIVRGVLALLRIRPEPLEGVTRVDPLPKANQTAASGSKNDSNKKKDRKRMCRLTRTNRILPSDQPNIFIGGDEGSGFWSLDLCERAVAASESTSSGERSPFVCSWGGQGFSIYSFGAQKPVKGFAPLTSSNNIYADAFSGTDKGFNQCLAATQGSKNGLVCVPHVNSSESTGSNSAPGALKYNVYREEEAGTVPESITKVGLVASVVHRTLSGLPTAGFKTMSDCQRSIDVSSRELLCVKAVSGYETLEIRSGLFDLAFPDSQEGFISCLARSGAETRIVQARP